MGVFSSSLLPFRFWKRYLLNLKLIQLCYCLYNGYRGSSCPAPLTLLAQLLQEPAVIPGFLPVCSGSKLRCISLPERNFTHRAISPVPGCPVLATKIPRNTWRRKLASKIQEHLKKKTNFGSDFCFHSSKLGVYLSCFSESCYHFSLLVSVTILFHTWIPKAFLLFSSLAWTFFSIIMILSFTGSHSSSLLSFLLPGISGWLFNSQGRYTEQVCGLSWIWRKLKMGIKF